MTTGVATSRAKRPVPGAERRKRRRAKARERGVALVLVLGALTILTIMLTDFQDETSAELGSSLSARDSLRAEFAARSGMQLARLLIAAEPTIRKAMVIPLSILGGGGVQQVPVWEFADQILGAFNGGAGTAKFAALTGVPLERMEKLGMSGAQFDLTIIDEDSKINLNAASRDPLTANRLAASIMGLIAPLQYEGLFTSRDGDGQYSDRQTTCGAILDWIDSDQNASTCDVRGTSGPTSGSEDSFYQLLDPPYYRKNAPLDSLDELHQIRGVSDDFWSTFIEPDYRDPRKRTMTVWGQGKVNVNTANAQTLLALVCGVPTNPPARVCTDPTETMKFIGLVTMVRTMIPGIPLFPSPKMFISTLKQQSMMGALLASMKLDPITFFSEGETLKAISTESKVFTLLSTGSVKAGDRTTKVKLHAVVDFRSAPAPGQLAANQLTQQLGGAASAIPGLGSALAALGGAPSASASSTVALPFAGFVPGQIPSGMPSGATPDGAFSFLLPNPGGRVVYFRVE